MATLNKAINDFAVGGKTASVDIPKPRNGGPLVGRDDFAAAAAKPAPTDHPNQMLPTPPNSISPSLPPQHFVGRDHVGIGGNRPPTPHALDSEDPDLQDSVGPRHRDDQGRTRPREHGQDAVRDHLDATGAITPALLAKYHLPDILLAHGPLAIRHLMNYLTISVPGFSRIPPARARRIVVSALEGRNGQSGGGDDHVEGGIGAGGGLNGEVIFEKVGWGRWDARLQGQPRRRDRRDPFAPGTPGHHENREHSPPASVLSSSSFSHSALPKDGHYHHHPPPRYPDRALAGTSWTEDSVVFSHQEDDYDEAGDVDYSAEEHEADKMSLDHEHDHSMASSSSEADPANGEHANGYPNENEELEDDITDDEDWAGIGAAALRQASYSAASSYPKYRGGVGYRVRRPLKRPSPSPPTSANPNHSNNHAPRQRFKSSSRTTYQPPRRDTNLRFSPPAQGLASNSQEREAIEALVKLSNV